VGIDRSEYIDIFLDESREALQSLNTSTLALERDPSDAGALAEVFRVAHTLKGMSATMGFQSMAQLTHRMEDVLTLVKDGAIGVSGETTDVLLQCLDALERMVDQIAGGGEGEPADELLARLAALDGSGAVPDPSSAPTAYESMVIAEAAARGLHVLGIRIQIDPACQMKSVRAVMVMQVLEAAGEPVRVDPPVEQLEAEGFDGSFAVWLVCDGDGANLTDAICAISEVSSATVEEIAGDRPAQAQDSAPIASSAGERSTARAPRGATVRVGADRLDGLMNLMGELVIGRTHLAQIAQDHDLPDLRLAAEEITRVTNDLQALVMQVRMMPVETVFMRFPRMVRDLAHELGKEVELVIDGEDTELDRTVIDEIGDPLVHLLRNAVDHGLEATAERVAAGKDATGHISLAAGYEGSSVLITVSDDGAGIDPGRIRDVAVARGVLDRAAADALADEQALELIFRPGFSTADVTTDISGRGVGLDAVRSKIIALGGDVRIQSFLGQGTTFTIRLPLTLAIIQALMVGVGDDVFAVPLEATEETVLLEPGQVEPVGGIDTMVLRDRVVPLYEIPTLLGSPGGRVRFAGRDSRAAVIIQVDDRLCGLVVDRLIGQQDIVIKHLPEYMGDPAGVAGATILGDGQVALIVDVSVLRAS